MKKLGKQLSRANQPKWGLSPAAYRIEFRDCPLLIAATNQKVKNPQILFYFFLHQNVVTLVTLHFNPTNNQNDYFRLTARFVMIKKVEHKQFCKSGRK